MRPFLWHQACRNRQQGPTRGGVKVSHLTVSGVHASDQDAPLPESLGGLKIQVCACENERRRV